MRKHRNNATRFKKESEQRRKEEQQKVRNQGSRASEGARDTVCLRQAMAAALGAKKSIDDIAKRAKWSQQKVREAAANPYGAPPTQRGPLEQKDWDRVRPQD